MKNNIKLPGFTAKVNFQSTLPIFVNSFNLKFAGGLPSILIPAMRKLTEGCSGAECSSGDGKTMKCCCRQGDRCVSSEYSCRCESASVAGTYYGWNPIG